MPAALMALCVLPATALGQGTSTSIEASSTRIHPGEWVGLTARTSPIPSSFPPEGTVTFYDGGAPIPGCDEMQIAGEGGATFCETPLNTPGKHLISASYSGTPDEEFEGSSSGQITIEVGEDTETTLGAWPTTATVGQTISFQAFTSPRTGLSESTDTFYDGGTPIEGCDEIEVIGEGGAGFCEASFSTPGVHVISVFFSGTRNGEYFPSSTQMEIRVEPAESSGEPAGEESSEEPAGEKGSEEPEGKEGAKEPGGEEGAKAGEEPHTSQQPSGPAPTLQSPAPLRAPFAPPASTAAVQRSAPALLSRPALLVINARRLRLGVRCGSPACALGADVSVRAGRRRWRLPAEVQPASRPGYAHLVIRIPARDRGDLRAFLLAHPHAGRLVQIVLGERHMTSTAALRLRTMPGLR